jgi:hypothetical protein
LTPSLIDILRKTLSQIEQNSEFRQDEPALVDLRRNVARAIGELEVAKSERQESEEQRNFRIAMTFILK